MYYLIKCGVKGAFMSLFRGVAEEERDRLVDLIKYYEELLAELPRGSILKREISGHKYAYLKYREEGIVKAEYLGRAEIKKVQELEKQIKERRRIEKLLRQAKSNLKEVNRVFHGK